jgi:hypothetical protein
MRGRRAGDGDGAGAGAGGTRGRLRAWHQSPELLVRSYLLNASCGVVYRMPELQLLGWFDGSDLI